MVAACALVAATGWGQGKPIRVEAENGQLIGGVTVSTARPGYSGSGYVTNFHDNNAGVRLKFNAVAGIYEARVRYSAPSQKGYGLRINGAEVNGMFAATGDDFGTTSAGKVELKTGENTLEIVRGWGYYDVDYIEFVPTTIDRKLRKPPVRPADPQATPQVWALLASLTRGYGHRTFSGQFQAADSDAIKDETGVTPAIFGDDLGDYSPSKAERGADPKNLVEKAIARAKKGQIITFSWHWNAPTGLVDTPQARWYMGFQANSTTFDFQAALNDPSSDGYKLLLRDIDAIAAQLKKCDKAGIPVLFRPLHEAEGGWFWWGAKGPQSYVQLWRLLFNRLTKVDHLHNLIWVFTVGSDPNWYPGDAYVDVLGVDAYPDDHSDPLSNTWDSLKGRYDGRKLIALTEFGGIPDIPRMRHFGVEWAYFVPWSNYLKATPVDTVRRVYRDASVVNCPR
jgi:mannan endo-1,4-beta-mannosidase